MTPRPILGLGSCRQVGKDTLARLLHELDHRCAQYSFATALKDDLKPFLRDHFGIDVWACSLADKEVIRPTLIGYGMSQRARDPDYWVKRIVDQIEEDLATSDVIPVVTDCRFVNEVTILRDTFPGFRFVHVTREGAPPPTDEEEKHYRAVAALADHRLHWGNETESQQLERAREVLRWLT